MCRADDFARILDHFARAGFAVRTEDRRWLGKICRGEDFVDLIFASPEGVMRIDDRWFEGTERLEIFGTEAQIIGPTELLWSKMFLQHRDRYDGADVMHLILRQHDRIDWRRLLSEIEPFWEALLVHLVNFRFVYPGERDRVPGWLIRELVERVGRQLDEPAPRTNVCRGRLYSLPDYEVDVKEWGFADVFQQKRARDG